MTNPSTQPSGEVQFDHAEFAAGPAQPECELCKQRLASEYFKVEGKVTCGPCRGRAESEWNAGTGSGRFVRALLFGFGASVAGAALYYGVAKITGYELGIISMVVGIAVGRAVNRGTRGRGGRGYQLLAVFLTYFALAGAYAPFAIEGIVKSGENAAAESAKVSGTSSPLEPAATQPPEQPSGEGPVTSPAASASNAVPASEAVAPGANASTGAPADEGELPVAAALAMLFVGLLALPVIVATSSIISAVIMLFGLWEAWRVNRARSLAVEGPYAIGAAAGSSSVPEAERAVGS